MREIRVKKQVSLQLLQEIMMEKTAQGPLGHFKQPVFFRLCCS